MLSEHLDSFLDAMINTATPIALGERLYSRWDFKSILASGDVIQEQSLGIHYNVGNDLLDYLTDRSVFDYADGFVAIPTGPGLGIDVNEDYVRERAEQGHRWRNPIWRHADGSIAEW